MCNSFFALTSEQPLFSTLYPPPNVPNPFRHDSLWEAVWTKPSESASPAAALVSAQGSGNVASSVSEGIETSLRAQDASCRDDSDLDALADALAGPLAVLGDAGQILRPLFQLAGASPSDGAAKAAAILLAELATAEGRPGVADACLRVMTAQPAMELVQALTNLDRPALRQRLLRRLAGREGAAAALVAAAVPHAPWLLNELVACGDAAEAVSSAFGRRSPTSSPLRQRTKMMRRAPASRPQARPCRSPRP